MKISKDVQIRMECLNKIKEIMPGLNMVSRWHLALMASSITIDLFEKLIKTMQGEK
jgi:hypothetical protein